ncbi:hypothetical protein GQ44DRAFT_616534 [Phaeosphaeriaceae sp. PMI808]|nr:hypothetical protein GQ44DRAFT_616534 [Phaeosphaeriaceae sp. PMI808]
MTSASEKPWLAAFKPRPPPIRELFASTTPSLLASDSQLLLQSAPILSKSPPPTETSETTTAASLLEDDSADALKNSKPDISIGFDRDGFSELHRRLLAELQYEGQLLSEPHAPQLGLHFPFLIVEAKGLTTSGSMIGAENQAAVAGACAINILHALAGLASDPSLDNTAALEPPCVIFSIATEGPNHELCFHFRTKGEYHMTVHRIWRPTLQQDCEEFIFALARIMYWGAEVLNKAIVASLNRAVERIYG